MTTIVAVITPRMFEEFLEDEICILEEDSRVFLNCFNLIRDPDFRELFIRILNNVTLMHNSTTMLDDEITDEYEVALGHFYSDVARLRKMFPQKEEIDFDVLWVFSEYMIDFISLDLNIPEIMNHQVIDIEVDNGLFKLTIE